MLEANAEFVGNFVLPVKVGDAWITLRTSTPDLALPPEGVRIQPADATLLARMRSPNTDAALKTAPGAHHWAIRYLEFRANLTGARRHHPDWQRVERPELAWPSFPTTSSSITFTSMATRPSAKSAASR